MQREHPQPRPTADPSSTATWGGRVPRWVPPLARAFTGIFLGTLTLVLFLYFWDALTSLLLMLLAAWVLAASAVPVVERLPGPRWLRGSVVGALWILAILSILALASWLVGDSIQRELAHWPEIRASLEPALARWLRPFGLEGAIDLDALVASIRDSLLPDSDAAVWVQLSRSLGGVLLVLALVSFGTIYMLVQPRGQLSGYFASLFPPSERGRIRATFARSEPRLRWWLMGVLVSMTLVSSLAWVAFTVLGLRFSVTLAVAAGVGELVPVLGPSSVFLAAFLVAAASDAGSMLGVVVLWFLIQTLESYVVVPLVMRKIVKLPPLVTIFTLVLWARLLGIGGLLLALPINLVIWTLLEQFVTARYEGTP